MQASALSNVFAIFDSHTRPTHPAGPAFIISASIDQTARYLEKLFAVDAEVLRDGGAPPGVFDAHLVVPGGTPPTVSGPGVGLSIRPTDPDVYAANAGMLAAQTETNVLVERLRRSEEEYSKERRLRKSRDARVRELKTQLHNIEFESARAHRGQEEDSAPDEKGPRPNEPEVAESKDKASVGSEDLMDLDIAAAAQAIDKTQAEPVPRPSTDSGVGLPASVEDRSITSWESTHPLDLASFPTSGTHNPPSIPDANLPAPEITFCRNPCQDTEPEVHFVVPGAPRGRTYTTSPP